MEILFESLLSSWQALIDETERRALIYALENGMILYLSQLGFRLTETERKFLSPHWLTGSRKNISLASDRVRGAQGTAAELEQLRAMMQRFSQQANQLALALFPQYAPYIKSARTSFRPAAAVQRASSWRQDDSRLHVDAFPSRPNRGERILRVFSNINPCGEARVWRVGEPFEQAAKYFLPRIGRPLPGSAQLLAALGITKGKRSEYDYLMLRLHDALKADSNYQQHAPQQTVAFAAGSTWICFSDQVLHAAMSGQHMLEQTLHLSIDTQYRSELSPLKTLERMRGRALIQ
ncbi:MAG TPA: Kdo hydroxylase family protein [Spongiibacteraceae bacterium]|jgi:hypothetical protein